jgi:virginiamycin A acetyltransferase
MSEGEAGKTSRQPRSLRRTIKQVVDGISLVLALPAAATCWIEYRLSPASEAVYQFWSHVFSLMPGLPGLSLRRAFYRLTLDHCHPDFYIGFGALFTHRQAHVEDGVYIGPYALVGSSRLGRGSMIGSRASLLSGTDLHEMDHTTGVWTPFEHTRLRQINVGEHAYIGEGAIIMANVGARSMVAAGTVVSNAVPAAVVVAGNPARFVRKIEVPQPAASELVAPAVAVAEITRIPTAS